MKYPNYKAKVVSKNEIEYDGKRYSLSGLSDKIMGKKCGQGKSYWTWKDKKVKEW